jgi:hypothetical protein
MWLERFLDTIRRVLPGDPLSGREKELAKLNPEKILVENVRSVLDVSQDEARRVCETAVRQGLFTRGVDVLCPNGSAAATKDREEDLPTEVTCIEEQDGHPEEVLLPTEGLRKIVFYRFNELRFDEQWKNNPYTEVGATSIHQGST